METIREESWFNSKCCDVPWVTGGKSYIFGRPSQTEEVERDRTEEEGDRETERRKKVDKSSNDCNKKKGGRLK